MTITAARKPRTTPPGQLFAGQSTDHPATTGDDIIDDILAEVAARLPAFTPTLRATVDAAVRDRWGGDKPYIAKRQGDGRSERNSAIRRDHRRGVSVAVLQRRYGLSRITLWRILGVDPPANT